MNEFHFFFETFLKLNNFKIFEMEMNESVSVCFFAKMPEVLISLRAMELRVAKRREKPVRSLVFHSDLSSPKESEKPLESRVTRNPAFQEDCEHSG